MGKRQTAYQKATQRIQTDGIKHCTVLYGATAIVLWKHYGKRGQAIRNLFDLSRAVWKDCAKDHDHSMIQMCEKETGIEIQNGDGSEWRNLWYLNGHIPDNMTYEQALYMRQQQIKWIRPQVMACLMISLNKKYRFGYERCAKIYQQIEETAQEYRSNPKRIRKACMELTGIDVLDVVTKKGEQDEKNSDADNDNVHHADADRRQGGGKELVAHPD